MRRQYRSCDQCRKAKRACDAPSLWSRLRNPGERLRCGADGAPDGALDGASHAFGGLYDNDDVNSTPCSYCSRTGKTCTLRWVRKQLREKPADETSVEHVEQKPLPVVISPPSQHAQTPFQESPPAQQPLPPPPPAVTEAGFPSQPLTAPVTSHSHPPSLHPPPHPHYIPQGHGEINFASPTTNDLPLSSLPDLSDGSDTQTSSASYSPYPGMNSYNPSLPLSDFPSPVGYESQDRFMQPSPMSFDATKVEVPFIPSKPVEFYPGHPSPATSSSGYNEVPPFFFNDGQWSDTEDQERSISLSPFSTAHVMTSNTNKTLISDNLLLIYHDAFELALSCCLSFEGCPYRLGEVRRSSRKGINWISRFENLSLANQYDRKKKDTAVYYRVMKLDRVAQAAKLIRLSKTQDIAVSRALYLVVMAYAAQWAQGGERERDNYPGNMQAAGGYVTTPPSGPASDFDYELRKSLWAQAKQAVEECAGIECFRIVCADWIMGFIQKPMEKGELAASWDAVAPETSFVGGMCNSIASQVGDIIATEDPPLFIERATRKVHALKYQYEARRAGIYNPPMTAAASASNTTTFIGSDDMATLNVMYWMSIMIETISSAIHGRPLVVSDEECQHNASYITDPDIEDLDINYQPNSIEWWSTALDQTTKGGPNLQWPCTYETAVKGIIAATPVKTIIFRYVSALQNCLRSNYLGEPVEKIISNALAIYKYWNFTYGSFFRGFIENHDQVATFMQVWFTHIISYSYHGVLLLADLIELVDQKGYGLAPATELRNSIGIVKRLREHCIAILSDLARISSSPSWQVTGMHFSLDKQTTLPEPWTTILIRAFSKVALLQLDELEKTARRDPSQVTTIPFMVTVERCEVCIKALYELRKKSDMASVISAILFSALRPYLIPPAGLMTPNQMGVNMVMRPALVG